MEMKPEKSVKLDNGLILNLFDVSRKIAGDRWFVSIIAQIEIHIDPKTFDDEPGIRFEDIRSLLGDKIVFEKKMERNFVDKNDKDIMISDIIQNFMADVVPYLSHQQFARKYIIKMFKEAEKHRQWYQ